MPEFPKHKLKEFNFEKNLLQKAWYEKIILTLQLPIEIHSEVYVSHSQQAWKGLDCGFFFYFLQLFPK